ncbi:hypothetical protein [Candidatus Fukatsuia endosymbiont of Tuberolachnus salignus]|uniref:hypothetical protein n=1 Tax=Candidatus Fukatsuia endosymbiont of Tuberolachnus salignus TaxID=3077957 RepID=UPI00313D61DB
MNQNTLKVDELLDEDADFYEGSSVEVEDDSVIEIFDEKSSLDEVIEDELAEDDLLLQIPSCPS